jgi:hypothetical protein
MITLEERSGGGEVPAGGISALKELSHRAQLIGGTLIQATHLMLRPKTLIEYSGIKKPGAAIFPF